MIALVPLFEPKYVAYERKGDGTETLADEPRARPWGSARWDMGGGQKLVCSVVQMPGALRHCTLCVSPATKGPAMYESKELRDLYIRMCEAHASGDSAFIERLFSRQAGTLAIGTDPSEWWVGSDRMLRAWKAQLEALGGKIPLAAGNPRAYQEGSVGWVADQPRFLLPDGELPFRLTCVFHQEEGEWRLVQTHASLGVSNEAAVGSALPT